jgi:hypothetical protein
LHNFEIIKVSAHYPIGASTEYSGSGVSA